MIQTQPAKGREVSIGRSMLPALLIDYYRTNPDTGELEHYCKTKDGQEFVTVIRPERLASLLTQLNDHVIGRLKVRAR
jgi:hypothetical protein